MLEWMHDPDVVYWLSANFASKTIEDCYAFIEYSTNSSCDLHMAIVDDDDNYMGTVSLRDMDSDDKAAEFAITIRKSAMGKGYSKYGMKEILRIGLEEQKLDAIYWCVSEKNERAVRFYDKNGYERVKEVPQRFYARYDEMTKKDLIWYMVK
jgi:diamine N-acetyltransferase